MLPAPVRRLRFVRDHRWAPGRLSDYLDGELGQASVGRLERHLAECPQCLAVLRGLERMLGALRGLSPLEPAPDIATAVRRRLHEPL